MRISEAYKALKYFPSSEGCGRAHYWSKGKVTRPCVEVGLLRPIGLNIGPLEDKDDEINHLMKSVYLLRIN